MAVNKQGYQPRYPCSDAEPNIPMSVDSIQDVPIYWNQDQLGSDTNGLINEDGGQLDDEDYLAAIGPDPIKFPNRHHQIRPPRCVRFYTVSAFFRQGAPVGDFSSAKNFVVKMKEEVEKLKIMFSVARNYTFCKLLFYPIDSILGIENTEYVGTFTPNNPLIDFPIDTYKYKYAGFNEAYLDEECYIGSDVLNFYIFDTPYYGDDFSFVTVGINAANFTPKYFYRSPNDTYYQAIDYYTRQNEKTRQRTIVQKWPGNNITSVYLDGLVPLEQMWEVFLATNDTHKLFEIGPDFTYDVDYYVETIKEHWSL